MAKSNPDSSDLPQDQRKFITFLKLKKIYIYCRKNNCTSYMNVIQVYMISLSPTVLTEYSTLESGGDKN